MYRVLAFNNLVHLWLATEGYRSWHHDHALQFDQLCLPANYEKIKSNPANICTDL